MNQVTAAEAEICSIAGGSDGHGTGMCYITVRLNRDRGNLKPFTFRLSRSDLMRLVEDGTHILKTSVSLNNPKTLGSCEDFVDVSSLPQRFDKAYSQNSPIDGSIEN